MKGQQHETGEVPDDGLAALREEIAAYSTGSSVEALNDDDAAGRCGLARKLAAG